MIRGHPRLAVTTDDDPVMLRRGERCHVAQHALYACGIGRREIVVTFQQRECGRLLFGVEIRFVHFGL